LLLVIKDSAREPKSPLAILRIPSMQGVGTKLAQSDSQID
jgi:hypothetical protein